MYWYRLEQSLGRFSIVGTTVKHPEHLPQDLRVDPINKIEETFNLRR